MRASADLEMQQVVSEVRRQAEKEKEIAIAETKRKKWVSLRQLGLSTLDIDRAECTVSSLVFLIHACVLAVVCKCYMYM